MSLISSKAFAAAPQRVADSVREMIRAQGLLPGAALPTYAQLCKDLGFSYVTVKRGMDLLERQGLVRRVPSQGSFVAKELAACARELRKMGLVFSGTRDLLFRLNFLAEIMRGILIESQPRGIDLHIFSIAQDGLVRADQLAEAGVDGVLLLDMENDDYLRAFAAWGTPGVVVDYRSDAAPLDFLACDNEAAAARVVRHLVDDLGHRRIVFVDGPNTHAVHATFDETQALLLRSSSDVVERKHVVCQALAQHGMPAAAAVLPSAEAVVQRLCAGDTPRRRPFTAVLTGEETGAMALVRSLTAAGVQVPRDVSVCAVAGAGDTMVDGRQLTYCRFNFVEMGREAVRLLVARCAQPLLAGPEIHRIGFEFVAGATSGKPRRGGDRGGAGKERGEARSEKT